jgi:hypothetical protein
MKTIIKNKIKLSYSMQFEQSKSNKFLSKRNEETNTCRFVRISEPVFIVGFLLIMYLNASI